MEIFTIASGSSGNAVFITDKNTRLLIDAGVSMKKIKEGINYYGYDLPDIDAILITHEHIDHIKGLGAISRNIDKPIYATRGTIKGIKNCKSIGEIDNSLFRYIDVDKNFLIDRFVIEPIKTCHDCIESVCYKINSDNKTVAVATDLGCADTIIVNKLKDLDTILIESNYDEKMLEVGTYPYELKQRISGKNGHLSNEQAGKLLNQILCSKLKNIILCHLSKDNNYPELALKTIELSIDYGKTKFTSKDFNIECAPRDNVSIKYII